MDIKLNREQNFSSFCRVRQLARGSSLLLGLALALLWLCCLARPEAVQAGQEVVGSIILLANTPLTSTYTAYLPVMVTAQTQQPLSFSLGWQASQGSNTNSVALGDLDEDSDLDAFVGYDSNANQVWLNDGNGSFNPGWQAPQGLNTNSVALGDLDGDGDLDAFVEYGNNPNQAWLNDGNGSFNPGWQAPQGLNTNSVALGDLDKDGDLDAFVGNGCYDADNCDPNQVWVNDGQSNFSPDWQAPQTQGTATPVLSDLDGDSDLDAFIAYRCLFNIMFVVCNPNQAWLNDGNGSFGLGWQAPQGWLNNHSVALGDLDNDGDPDAFTNYHVVGYNSIERNEVWLNDGHGSFSPGWQAQQDLFTHSVALGDLDSDGDLDAFSSSTHVWLNNGKSSFEPGWQAPQSEDTRSVALGDLNGDGDLDAFLGNYGNPNQVYENGSNLFFSYLDKTPNID